jgi:hypothetical protein
MQTRDASLEGTGEIPLRRLVREVLYFSPKEVTSEALPEAQAEALSEALPEAQTEAHAEATGENT